MNSTAKFIFAAVIAANLAAIAAVSIYTGLTRSAAETPVIQLGKIVVTPADAETPTIELGTVVVTPSDADRRFAEAHGVWRPSDTGTSVSNRDAGQAAMTSLLQSIAALSPGQYLDTDAALRALDALVFDNQGR